MKRLYTTLMAIFLVIGSMAEAQAQRTIRSVGEFKVIVRQANLGLKFNAADSAFNRRLIEERILSPTIAISNNMDAQRVENWRAQIRNQLGTYSRDPGLLRSYLQSVDVAFAEQVRKGREPEPAIITEKGDPGINCWDTNGNRQSDPIEDVNGDGLFNAVDCRGSPGRDAQVPQISRCELFGIDCKWIGLGLGALLGGIGLYELLNDDAPEARARNCTTVIIDGQPVVSNECKPSASVSLRVRF